MERGKLRGMRGVRERDKGRGWIEVGDGVRERDEGREGERYRV